MNLRVTTSLGLGGLLLVASGLFGLQAANASVTGHHGHGDRPYGYSSASPSPSLVSASPSALASPSPTPRRNRPSSPPPRRVTPSPNTPSLPVTGSRVGPIVLAGLLLVCCGALLMVARVRRPKFDAGH